MYYDVALLTEDQEWLKRTFACAAEQDAPAPPADWAFEHRYEIASAPGFGDKYAYALETGVANPGKVQEVISDGELLSRVQELLAA